MVKIVLAEIFQQVPGCFAGHSTCESLGVRYIASALLDKGYNVKVIEDTKESIENKVLNEDADIFGFSSLTLHWPFVENISKKIKQNKNSKIIAGSYHPSSVPEVVKNPNIDTVVIGEGEETIKELIPALLEEKDLQSVNGITYSKNGEVIRTLPRKRIDNLDSIPWPIRDKEILKKTKTYGLTYPAPNEQTSLASITYSRGCPHMCDFCSSPILWGKQVKWRDAKDTIKEIKELKRKYDVNYIYFTDLTFNLNKKKVEKLCSELKKNDINWWAMASCTGNTEIYKKMAEAGCTRLGIGVETINYESRKNIGKKGWKNIEEHLKAIWDTGIFTRAYLMIGYPWETEESLKQTCKELPKLLIDDLKITFYTPFPGTSSYAKYKDLIITNDLSKFDPVNVAVLKPEKLNIWQLYKWRKRIFQDFYQSQEYQKRMESKIKQFPHLKKSYDEHFEFLEQKGILK